MVTLIAAGDPHEDVRKLEKFYKDCALVQAELVILQGDYLAQHEKDRQRAAQRIRELFLHIDERCPRFLTLGGNYEPPGSTFLACSGLEAKGFPLGSSDSVGSKGNLLEADGFVFVGIDGTNPINGTHPGERSEEELSALLESTIPTSADPKRLVLVTHAPPYLSGKRDELGMFGLPQAYWGRHVGSTAIREALAKYRPILHICGHVHEGVGVSVFDWDSKRLIYDLPTTGYERFCFRVGRNKEITICLNHGTLEHWVYFVISIEDKDAYTQVEVEKRRLGGKDPLSKLVDRFLRRGRIYDRLVELLP